MDEYLGNYRDILGIAQPDVDDVDMVRQGLLDVKPFLGEARLRCAARLDPIIWQRAVVQPLA